MNKNTKGKIFLVAFKISKIFTLNKTFCIIGIPIRLTYKILFQWILGIDIPDRLRVGKNFQVFHGQGLIINEDVIIGNNVLVRQNTTIGVAKDGGESPVIGDNVNIGANSVVIGAIKIGNNSIIAAGSIVVEDVPENSVVAGNPARVIKMINENS
jgi:putative colanic acid biosynthesis acetyltransferase WcaB